MKIIKKARAFSKVNRKTKFLLIEAFIQLGRARYLKSIPFLKVASTLGEPMTETSFSLVSSSKEDVARVSKAIQLMSGYTFWESQCLVKAIAAMNMLEKRNIECTLYLGTAKDDSGDLIAHAWLRSGPFYISGSEVMERFTIVAKFAKEPNFNKLQKEKLSR